MARPSAYPDHDTSNSNSVATAAQIQANGWPERAQVPNTSWNWLHQLAGKWLRYFGDSTQWVASQQSGTGTVGVEDVEDSFVVAAGEFNGRVCLDVRGSIAVLNNGDASDLTVRLRFGRTADALGSREIVGSWTFTAPTVGTFIDFKTVINTNNAETLLYYSTTALFGPSGSPAVYQKGTGWSAVAMVMSDETSLSFTFEWDSGADINHGHAVVAGRAFLSEEPP
ncbi:MAG: hypothetical protein JSV86_13195 [Gemmatimonadota bacterium]|nr:MAG: hypothetical protein JSV86_13195 [Gemmatimonadota bacterium]